MSQHSPARQAPPSPEWPEYAPQPFSEITSPVSNVIVADTVWPILKQTAGLAVALQFALATPDVRDFHLLKMEDALEVLARYLEKADAIFTAWTQAKRIHPGASRGEEGQA